MKPKRYLLFQWDRDPEGGWADLVGSYDTPEQAFSAVAGRTRTGQTYTEIIDLETGEDVYAR